MKVIMSYIGYIMGILGFAGIIWTYAQKQAEKDYDVKDLKKEIIEIKTDISDIKANMAVVSDIERLSDTIHYNNAVLKNQINGISVKSTNIISQLTRHLANDSSVTKDDLMQIMDELNEKKN